MKALIREKCEICEGEGSGCLACKGKGYVEYFEPICQEQIDLLLSLTGAIRFMGLIVFD